MTKSILLIPDAHAHPEYGNERFDHLGHFIRDTRPDTIVCMGDGFDMASLSQYDRGKKTGEGRRYEADIEAGVDGFERIAAPLSRLRYSPRKLYCLGNHEARIKVAVNNDPKLHGKLSYDDLELGRLGWDTCDYGEFHFYAGWAFTHAVLGDTGRALGGKNIARTLLGQHMSIAVGHNHHRDFAEDVRPDGKRVIAVSTGCYASPLMVEDWNKGSQHRYWNGVVMMHGCASGQTSGIEFIDAARLAEEYA